MTYFEQKYPKKVLCALGCLVVRVNLIEQSQIRLFAALLGHTTTDVAKSMFYSTTSGPARADLIKSVIPFARLTEIETKKVNDVLDRVGGLSKRRNDLIHGQWEFDKDRFKVSSIQPKRFKDKSQPLVATEKLILQLAADYRSTGELVDITASNIARRIIASKTDLTPSAGSPVKE